MRAYTNGKAPRAHAIRVAIGSIRIGLGFGDFSGSVPRFAFFGSIIAPGRKWTRIARIWNLAFQVHKVEAPK
jgi:hypothetical protein